MGVAFVRQLPVARMGPTRAGASGSWSSRVTHPVSPPTESRLTQRPLDRRHSAALVLRQPRPMQERPLGGERTWISLAVSEPISGETGRHG